MIQGLYEANRVRYKNPETQEELIIPVMLVPTVCVDDMKKNVIENSKLDREWLTERPLHDGTALVCGAGPSLLDTLDDIRELKKSGAVIFSCNSAAKFLNDHGIESDYQVILDSHHSTINEVGPAKKHLLASLVHPSLFDHLPNAILWHPVTAWIEDCIGKREFTGIGGGITVSNSAICIAYTLGFKHIHSFGMDSSHRETTHATPQPPLEGQWIIDIESKGKVYKTTFDFKAQVLVFEQLYKLLIDEGRTVTVHGSGLLPDLYTSIT